MDNLMRLVDLEVEIVNDVVGRDAIAVIDGTTMRKVKYRTGEEREEPKWFWLPRSMIEINEDGTVTVPETLAFEKGLI